MSLVAVADVGTCSTKVLIGGLEQEVISLAGVGKSKSRGVKNGRIVKTENAGQSLREAAKRAEEMASEQIQYIYLGVGGDLLQFSSNKATVTISSNDRIVAQRDVSRLKDLVSSIEMGINEKVISTIPQGFALDGQEGVTNPVGLQGRRLDMTATLVTIDAKWMENFRKTVAGAGYELATLLPGPQCTGGLLLTEEEKRRGKILIDFGLEKTELLVFNKGAMVDHLSVSLGGKSLTGDLSARLNLTPEEARKIKHEFDLSSPGKWQKNPDKHQTVPKNREANKQSEILSTLSARTQEIFELILSKIKDHGYDHLLKYGIIVTGGSTRLSGLIEFLDNTFEPNFEQGIPSRPIVGIKDVIENPSYGPVMGILNCALERKFEGKGSSSCDSIEFRLSNWIRKKLRSIFMDLQ